jgi:formamidase
MAPIKTPRAIVSVDPSKRPWEQAVPLHNRWHPEIPAVGEVREGEVFRVETVDWTGRQIHNDDSAEDMKRVDLTSVRDAQSCISGYGEHFQGHDTGLGCRCTT